MRANLHRSFRRHFAAIACIAFATPNAPGVALDLRWVAGGHDTSVEGVAFSPDGAFAATSAQDETVKVWRVADGRLLHTFVHPSGFDFHAVIFAPDGLSVVAGGTGGAYQWRIADGALIRQFCCMETAYDLAYSPDGTILAAGGSLEGLVADVVLFVAASTAVLHELHGDDAHYMFSVVFTQDGAKLLSAEGSPFGGLGPGQIRVWDVASGARLQSLSGHTKRVSALALAPDGLTFASASEDRTVKLWDMSTLSVIRTFTGHTDYVAGVAFAPDGLHLASSSADTDVRIWDIATGTTVQQLTDFSDDVAGIEYSPDGSLLLAGGGRVFTAVADPMARLWHADGEPAAPLTQFPARILSIALSGDGSALIVGGGYVSGFVGSRSTADGATQWMIPQATSINRVACDPNGQGIATAAQDRAIRLHDPATGAVVRTLTGHTGSIAGLAFSPDGGILASSSFSEPIRLWNATTGALIRTLTSADNGASMLVFSPDGQYLLSGKTTTVRMWRVSDGAQIRTFNQGNNLSSIAYAPDGDFFASGDFNSFIKLWDPATGVLLRTFADDGAINTLAITHDSVVLSSSAWFNPALSFWRAADGALLDRIETEVAPGVTQALFTSDDRLLAFSRRDNTIILARNPLGPAPGDYNADGVIDLTDYEAFAQCLAGPQSAPDPSAPVAAQQCLSTFDADADADVDLQDFAAFDRISG